MANITKKMYGTTVSDNIWMEGHNWVSEEEPTGHVVSSRSYRGSVDLQNFVPSTATVISCRADSGLTITQVKHEASYTESDYSALLNPTGSKFGLFNSTQFALYLQQYGITTVYYRVGLQARTNFWHKEGPRHWGFAGGVSYIFNPWFEITYKENDLVKKIKISLTEPTLGTQHWQRVSTYTAVDTPEGLKWAECEVRYCMVPVEWSDIPNASEEEQPRTTGYEPVGNDVERKILRGYTGTNATVGRRVRGNDNYRCFTIHNAPAGTYTVRFTCSFTCRLLRISHDGDVESVNITYQPGDVHEYTITTTTTDFLGFTFIFDSGVQGETFEAGLGEATGEPEWVLCGEEA